MKKGDLYELRRASSATAVGTARGVASRTVAAASAASPSGEVRG